MFSLFRFILAVLASAFKSKYRLEAENATLRHQLIVLRRKIQRRVGLTNNDRWFLIQLYRWFPSILRVITVVQPETLLRNRFGMPFEIGQQGLGCIAALFAPNPSIEIEPCPIQRSC